MRPLLQGHRDRQNVPVPLCKVSSSGEWPVAKGRRVKKLLIGIVLLSGLVSPGAQVWAGEPSLPPHLIQSVSGQDIYEGMLSLDLFHCPVLQKADLQAACENVRDSVVRIDMGQAYGSGVIFRITADGVVIATNRHVLEYWREETGLVRFSTGYGVNARILGCDRGSDVGFLLVGNSELELEALLGMRSVPVEEERYASLQKGEDAFCLGADRETEDLIFQEIQVEETDRYIETFGGEMLYGFGFAKEGMSGGGIFDGCGHLIGLLAGGTYQNEIAGVPVDQVQQAYREIAGD